MEHQRIVVSDLKVDCFESVEQAANYCLVNGKNKTAVAINPEKILASIDSEESRSALLNADIRFMDGIGVVKVAEKKHGNTLTRVPGCELWESLMIQSVDDNKTVFLLGATNDVVKETEKKLRAKYKVNIVGSHSGYFTDDSALIDMLRDLKPDILTVAMGSPRQELFMEKCRNAGITSFMMGVGGTYDVFVGKTSRAPKLWCKYNLEWLHRLLVDPRRVIRYTKLVRFAWLAFTNKL